MSNFSILLHGQASDVSDLLVSLDSDLDTSELVAALINCFNRIEHLEKQIQKLGHHPAPPAKGPSDDDLDLLVIAIQALRPEPSPGSHDLATVDRGREILREWLARFGHHTAPVPVPVAERLPGPEDCTTNPRNGQGQWCWGWVQHDPIPYSGRWRMMRREWLADEAVAWLPAHALPLPAGEGE